MLNDSGPSLQLNNVTVNASQHVSYMLGVHFSSDLSLDKHVSSISVICFYHLRQLRHIQRSLDADSVSTLVRAFMTSRVDYCNAILAGALKTTTDRLQRVLNAAALTTRSLTRDCHDWCTRSYTGWTFPSEWSTSWACLPTGVCSARRQCTCQTVAFQSPKSLHVGIYAPLHVISWPYLDIVSARSGGGHLLSLVRRRSTLCQMICEIPQSA